MEGATRARFHTEPMISAPLNFSYKSLCPRKLQCARPGPQTRHRQKESASSIRQWLLAAPIHAPTPATQLLSNGRMASCWHPHRVTAVGDIWP